MKAAIRMTTLALGLALAFGNANAVTERQGPVVNTPTVGGYPAWYMDTSGLTMEFCDPRNATENDGGWCLVPANVVPENFPTNFVDEHFYYSNNVVMPGDAQVGFPKKMLWESAIEAAFAGPVESGGQIVFSRIRMRLEADDFLPAGTYRFIHPYGVDEAILEADPATPGFSAEKRIFISDDIGIACPPGQFDCLLNSRFGPYLVPSNSVGGAELPAVTGPVPGKLYLADPGRSGPVTGSPLGATRNMVRMEAPAGSGLFGGADFVEGSNFNVMGRIFQGPIPSELRVDRASYEELTGLRKVDVLAQGQPAMLARLPNQAPSAKTPPVLSFIDQPCGEDANGLPIAPTTGGAETAMLRSDTSYWAQQGLGTAGARPTDVCVKDNKVPATPVYRPAKVTDHVQVSDATYDPINSSLAVTAASTEPSANPVLTVLVPGATAPVPPVTIASAGSVLITVAAPPALVVVESTRGGRTAIPVKIGFGTAAGDPTTPAAHDDLFQVAEDSLNNSLNVLGNDTQVDGGTLAVATQPAHGAAVAGGGTISYSPNPNYAGPDTFTYTVSGLTATASITVSGGNDAPVAVNDSGVTALGAPQPLTLSLLANDTDADGNGTIRGAVVTSLPASGTLTAGGAAVVPNVEVVGGVVVYTPTVSGPFSFDYRAVDTFGASGNTATASLNVCAAETLTPTGRVYNQPLTRWIVSGTSSCPGGQTITVTLQAGNALVGTAVVQPNGSWSIVTTTGPVVTAAGNIVLSSTLGGNSVLAYNFKP